MSLTSAIIGSKSIREQSYRKDGILVALRSVAMQIKHLYGRKFYSNENVPNSSSAFGKKANNNNHTNDMSKKVTMIERQRAYENKIKKKQQQQHRYWNQCLSAWHRKKTGGRQGETER